jgi:hypothetical protein
VESLSHPPVHVAYLHDDVAMLGHPTVQDVVLQGCLKGTILAFLYEYRDRMDRKRILLIKIRNNK